jgi:hypothetical protein
MKGSIMRSLCPQDMQSGRIALVALVILVIGVAGALTLYSNTQLHMVNATPTVSHSQQRMNPQPTSAYSLSVDVVNPGKSLLVSQVTLGEPAKITVSKDAMGKQILIGNSEVLPKGLTNAISIPLTTSIKDGDVVVIRLETSLGLPIQNSEGSVVSVQKPVGMIMTHYKSEY